MVLDFITNLLSTTKTSSASSSNKTNLLSRRSITRDSRSATKVLMVTTTVWVINRVHAYTAYNWPAVSLGLVLKVSTTSFHQRLINTTTTGNNTNGSSAIRFEDLFNTRRKFD